MFSKSKILYCWFPVILRPNGGSSLTKDSQDPTYINIIGKYRQLAPVLALVFEDI